MHCQCWVTAHRSDLCITCRMKLEFLGCAIKLCTYCCTSWRNIKPALHMEPHSSICYECPGFLTYVKPLLTTGHAPCHCTTVRFLRKRVAAYLQILDKYTVSLYCARQFLGEKLFVIIRKHKDGNPTWNILFGVNAASLTRTTVFIPFGGSCFHCLQMSSLIVSAWWWELKVC